MKTSGSAAAILLVCAVAARAATPASVTSLRAFRDLPKSEAAKSLPVAFEATVTYYNHDLKRLFVQDGDAATFVRATTTTQFVPGDRVLVHGTTRASFSQDIVSSDIVLLRHGSLPPAHPAIYDELIQAQYDARLVTVHGLVRAADLHLGASTGIRNTVLRLLVSGGYIDVYVDGDDARLRNALLDAEVEITGIAGERFDGKLEQTGIEMYVNGFAYIKMIHPAQADPWSLAATPIQQILGAYHVEHRTRRVLVRGTVTYFEPGAAAVIQDGPRSLWVETKSREPVTVGDLAEVTGFPTNRDGFLTLTSAEIRDHHNFQPVTPYLATWKDLASSKHLFDLVTIEGQVVMVVRETVQDEYVLYSDGYLFSALYRHPKISEASGTVPLKETPIGSRVRVTGICILDDANPFNGNVAFNIMLRAPNDVVMIARPSWFNIRHVTLVAGLLLLLVLVIGLRGWYLESRIRRRISSLAYFEQRRSRILEAINSSQPLSQILEQITELVSFKLNGAPCWCQISEGATLGNRPARLAPSLRTAEHPIAARNGPQLGVIYAAFDARTTPGADEDEALVMAAGLATLAIETYRLYTDLVHRSEFDLLTDVQNRFSMERMLETLIEEARKSAGIFGLIYIDLDDFKKVNDVYGHLVGDLYLQEAAQRMKRQLRPGDMLARLGGDEFAVLVANIRCREDAQEIAARLRACFDAPFLGDGFALQGSASIGFALYPESAGTADNLLRAADAAMYEVKKSRPGRRPKATAEDSGEYAGKSQK